MFPRSVEVLESRTVPSAVLVRDINTNTADAAPANMTDLNGRVLFSAVQNSGDVGLYTTTGTAAGTALVRSFPATAAATPTLDNFTVIGGTVFFTINRQRFGGPRELWATDGTAAGTRLVRDFGTDQLAFTNSPPVIAFGGRVYLLIRAQATGTIQLWQSDGTTTAPVAPGAFRVNEFFPALTPLGGHLYFAASDPVNGPKLWRTDGSVAEIADADVPAREANGLTRVGDSLYFFGTTDPTRQVMDLYRTDGTTTTPVRPGFANSDLRPGADLDGRLVFSAADATTGFKTQLWTSDGSAGGTAALSATHTGPRGLNPYNLTVVGDRVVFNGSPEVGSPFLPELWATDGTAAGTQVLVRTTTAVVQLFPPNRTVAGDVLYFGVAGAGRNAELWRTDGTGGGTARVFDFGASAFGLAPSELAVSGGMVYLSASDLRHGVELWTTDGTSAGTRLVTDLNTNTVGSGPTDLTEANGRLYFTADGGSDAPRFWPPDVWRTNGSERGTKLVDTPFPATGPTRFEGPANLTAVGGQVFFTGTNAPQLWVTTRHPAGSMLLRDFSSLEGFVGPPQNLTAVGARLYFTVESPADGLQQLWTSDGTVAGTVLVAERLLIAYGSGVAVGGRFVFAAIDPATFTTQLWRSDGTAAGTRVLDAAQPGTAVRNLTVVDGQAYYFDADATSGFTVWRTDGRRTKLVADVRPGPDSWFEYNPVAVDGRLMFAAMNGATGDAELWTTTNRPEGAKLVAAVRPDFEPPAAVGDRLFFTVTDAAGGRALWVSNGTATRTRAVAPLVAGTDPFGDPLPFNLTAFKGFVFLTATDPASGLELWQSDGTAAGTGLADDVFPGPTGSAPGELTVSGGRLYFAATDRAHGRELWSVQTPNGCPPEGRGERAGRAAPAISWEGLVPTPAKPRPKTVR